MIHNINIPAVFTITAGIFIVQYMHIVIEDDQRDRFKFCVNVKN